jgi:hypothetical protein
LVADSAARWAAPTAGRKADHLAAWKAMMWAAMTVELSAGHSAQKTAALTAVCLAASLVAC